jgi:hypothetical protein
VAVVAGDSRLHRARAETPPRRRLPPACRQAANASRIAWLLPRLRRRAAQALGASGVSGRAAASRVAWLLPRLRRRAAQALRRLGSSAWLPRTSVAQTLPGQGYRGPSERQDSRVALPPAYGGQILLWSGIAASRRAGFFARRGDMRFQVCWLSAGGCGNGPVMGPMRLYESAASSSRRCGVPPVSTPKYPHIDTKIK